MLSLTAIPLPSTKHDYNFIDLPFHMEALYITLLTHKYIEMIFLNGKELSIPIFQIKREV